MEKMQLIKVSFTGADSNTDIKGMKLLSQDYPFIEWALLLSRNQQGKQRYPSLRWLYELEKESSMKTAIHLCGSWARSALSGDYEILRAIKKSIYNKFERVQLNIGDVSSLNPMDVHAFCIKSEIDKIQTILGTKQPNNKVFTLARSAGVMLDDKSGGKGIPTTFDTPPSNTKLIGFAGGMGPDNVEEKLVEIQKLDYIGKYWIDMESGLRTDNEFQLDKCEAVAKSIKHMI